MADAGQHQRREQGQFAAAAVAKKKARRAAQHDDNASEGASEHSSDSDRESQWPMSPSITVQVRADAATNQLQLEPETDPSAMLSSIVVEVPQSDDCPQQLQHAAPALAATQATARQGALQLYHADEHKQDAEQQEQTLELRAAEAREAMWLARSESHPLLKMLRVVWELEVESVFILTDPLRTFASYWWNECAVGQQMMLSVPLLLLGAVTLAVTPLWLVVSQLSIPLWVLWRLLMSTHTQRQRKGGLERVILDRVTPPDPNDQRTWLEEAMDRLTTYLGITPGRITCALCTIVIIVLLVLAAIAKQFVDTFR